jgi:hypothetical protein
MIENSPHRTSTNTPLAPGLTQEGKVMVIRRIGNLSSNDIDIDSWRHFGNSDFGILRPQANYIGRKFNILSSGSISTSMVLVIQTVSTSSLT